jgi:2-polyprenyl-3-methyl-5-hydroxy-6-metoxy-1,4-benzoquinol methylase
VQTVSIHHEPPAQEHAIESVPCNLCGSNDFEELYRLQDCRLFVDDIEWPVVRCRSCGLDYLNPRPTAKTIWRYYPAHYYEGRQERELTARYQLQARQLDALAPGALLDIGCANGDWIQLMAARGWQVAGLEPSPNSQNPHGLDIRKGLLPEGATWREGTFDVVTAWAVVEHLHDPRVAFETAQRMLRPGGRFIALVPNGRSIASRLAYREDVPRHLYMFSESTLARYAEQSGLQLHEVHHEPRLFGGLGRGVLRVQLFKALGHKPREYFRSLALTWPQRFRQHPGITCLSVPLALGERLVLSEGLVRKLRLSGHVIAHMQKP